MTLRLRIRRCFFSFKILFQNTYSDILQQFEIHSCQILLVKFETVHDFNLNYLSYSSFVQNLIMFRAIYCGPVPMCLCKLCYFNSVTLSFCQVGTYQLLQKDLSNILDNVLVHPSNQDSQLLIHCNEYFDGGQFCKIKLFLRI